MQEKVEQVKVYYDANAQGEWERLEHHRAEFIITSRFMERYIKTGDTVLDVGGGPGRYSLHFAAKGNDVTLVDLSPGNAAFAKAKAAEMGLPLTALAGDARVVDTMVEGEYDHVFLMGPLYHLLEEADRVAAVEACMKKLKPGGLLYVSFISSIAGIIYMMKYEPTLLQSNPIEVEFAQLVIDDKPFAGVGFTQCYFIRQQDVLPFMERFPLEKLHFFGQESILSPCEPNIDAQTEEVRERWYTFAGQVCEKQELLSFSEHLMYIGRKRG